MNRKLLALAATAIAFAAPAHAGFLGKTVRTQYLFSDQATVVESHDVVVGAGIEVPSFLGYFALDLADHTVTATANANSSFWNAASFSGFSVTDFNDTVGDITGVTINAATTMVIDASRITFDANHIFVNWQGLAYTNGTVLSFDVTTADDVPEPAMLGLFGLGAIGLGLSRRRAGKR